MKIPLRYQVTEYDCATASLYNALSYLFERHEIPLEIFNKIHEYTLDCSDGEGNSGQGGTSRNAIDKLINFLNNYNKFNFRIQCTKLDGEKVKHSFNDKSCILVRVWLELVEHYVIITKIHKNRIYVFDPYYLVKDEYKDRGVKIKTKPLTYNRIISFNRLFSKTNMDYSLVKKDDFILIEKL